MLNQCALVGKIKEMPHVVVDARGLERTVLVLSVERPFRDENGVYDVDDMLVEVWRGIAETTMALCRPGSVIGLRGRLQVAQFADKKGAAQPKLEVIAEKISFLSSRILAEAKLTESTPDR